MFFTFSRISNVFDTIAFTKIYLLCDSYEKMNNISL